MDLLPVPTGLTALKLVPPFHAAAVSITHPIALELVGQPKLAGASKCPHFCHNTTCCSSSLLEPSCWATPPATILAIAATWPHDRPQDPRTGPAGAPPNLEATFRLAPTHVRAYRVVGRRCCVSCW